MGPRDAGGPTASAASRQNGRAPPLDGLDRAPPADEQGGVEMAEVVEGGPLGHAGDWPGPVPHGAECVAAKGVTGATGEHEAVLAGAIPGKVGSERGRHDFRHGHRTEAGLALGRAELGHTTQGEDELAVDSHLAT